MSKKFEPHSLQVLYRDFLLPNQEQNCCACNRRLSTGVAVFLVVESAPAPFGPYCAAKFCKTKTTGIPDHTVGLTFLQQDEAGEADVLSAVKNTAREITPRQQMTDEQKEVARAVLYASLRSSRLPTLGFFGLNYAPLDQFLKTYNTGKLDHVLLKSVHTTMKKTAVGTALEHFSLENLRACYVNAWLLRRIFDETRAPEKRMGRASYDKWNNLDQLLRKDLFLTQQDCIEVQNLASQFLASPPTKVNVQFVGPKPPRYFPRSAVQNKPEAN